MPRRSSFASPSGTGSRGGSASAGSARGIRATLVGAIFTKLADEARAAAALGVVDLSTALKTMSFQDRRLR